MNTLFVSLDIPFPPHKGQRMRNWSILRALVAERHEVSLISFAEETHVSKQTAAALNAVCRNVVLLPLSGTTLPTWRAHLRRLRGLASPIPFGAWRFRSPALVAAVHDHLAHHRCDIVIWDEAYNLENLARPLPVPVVLNSHDIMQVIWRRYLAVERHPLKRLYAWLECQKLQRWEARAHQRANKIFAVSAHDASVLRSLCSELRVHVVPNTVDIAQYEPTLTDDGATVLFVGGMDWFPNLDAARFFIREVFPSVRRSAPEARFVVVGHAPTPAVRAQLEVSGVRFLGRVHDIRSDVRGGCCLHRAASHRQRCALEDPRGGRDGQGDGLH